MITPFETVRDALQSRGYRITGSGSNLKAQCPAHEDDNPSLSVSERKDGGVLLKCHAGCGTPDVVSSLGLTMRDLFAEEYRYEDATGKPVRTVHRTYDSDGRKQFRQDGITGQPTLYRLPQVLAAVAAGETVYLVEGEKDVHSLESLGVTSTTAPMGASNFNRVDASPLEGARVVAIVDNDDAGTKWAHQVAEKLKGIASVEFLHAPMGKDASDHIAIGGLIADLAPWDFPTPDGDRLLTEVRDWFGRYLKTVTPSDLDLLTLWAVHTHVAFECFMTPRLLIDSPVPGSGKTTCLEHLSRLAMNPVQMASVSSPAMLTRMLEAGPRTLLIDEADRSLSKDKDGIGDLLAVLNSGYKRGATRPVLVPDGSNGWVAREMSTFAPVAMAGNNPQLPEDTRSRTIRVLLLPDHEGLVEESDWELIEDDAADLGARIAAWAEENRDAIREIRPPMPDGIKGRFREKWQPLKRVAAIAGGHWAGVVDALAVHDREQVEMDRDDGMIAKRPHVALLEHLAEIWPTGATFVPTVTLVNDLIATYPHIWGKDSAYTKDLTVQRFGRMMATAYKVNSWQRPDGNRERGYTVASLGPVWKSMGITPPSGTVQTVRTIPTVPLPHGSDASNTPNGSNETPCRDCGQPLHRISTDEGHNACPGCECTCSRCEPAKTPRPEADSWYDK